MPKLLIAYIILIHALLVAILLKPDLPNKVLVKLGAAKLNNPQLDRMLIYHSAMDSSIEPDATIFLGDSITQSLATASVTDKGINFGIGQQTTREMLTALPMYKSLSRVKRVFIAIGINDVLRGEADGITSRFLQIAAHIPANTPIVWSAIIPTLAKSADTEAILKLRDESREFCKSLPNCKFIDTPSLFLDANGTPDPSNYLDGLHLSEKGYRLWIDAMKAAI